MTLRTWMSWVSGFAVASCLESIIRNPNAFNGFLLAANLAFSAYWLFTGEE
jgi:hypothetical protein